MQKGLVVTLLFASQLALAGTLSFKPNHANRSDGTVVPTTAEKISLFNVSMEIPEVKGQLGLLLRDVNNHICIVPQSALPGVDLSQLGQRAVNAKVDIVCTVAENFELPASNFYPLKAESVDITGWLNELSREN
jgi:hypothetical protein